MAGMILGFPPLFGFKKRSCPWPGHQPGARTKELAQGQLSQGWFLGTGRGLVSEAPVLRDELVALVQVAADERAKNRFHFADAIKVFIDA